MRKMLRRVILPIVIVSTMLILVTATNSTDPTHMPAPPNTDVIQHIVKAGKVIRINATWDYKIYENGKQVIDPFATLLRGTNNDFSLASFTIYPRGAKNVNHGYTHQGFAIVDVSGSDYSITEQCDLQNAEGRQYTTNYKLGGNGTIVQKITTLVRFIAPCSGGYLLPLNHVHDWAGYKETWDINGWTCYGHGSLLIPANFTKGLPYTVTLIDNGIHNFSSSTVSIANGSYLYLLRGFFKMDSDPSITLVSPSGGSYTPEVDWHQSRISGTLANIKIDLVNNQNANFTVQKIVFTFNKLQYGLIQFTSPITLGPSDYIELNINIKA